MLWKSDDGENLFDKFFKNKKHMTVIYVILIIGMIFLGISSLLPEETEISTNGSAPMYDNLEDRLEDALSDMEGVGRAEVVVTYASSRENLLATDVETDRSDNSERFSEKVVTVNSGGSQTPVVRGEKTPIVKGVIIICDGGGDVNVQKNLMGAIEALTGVSPHNIGIFARKK